MSEPYPGTQVIYEHFADCPTKYTAETKSYPPNTTLIVNNPCEHFVFDVQGEITKLVVESNYGGVYLKYKYTPNDEDYPTKEVVVKSNSGTIYVYSRVARIEIQENTNEFGVYGTVAEHVDVKKSTGVLFFPSDTNLW